MSRASLGLVVLVQFIALLVVCLVVRDNGWDDGAITLAFARTFARHGVVGLTPHSETVEGFSTVSWFFLNAAAALVRPSYHAAILVSQVMSVLCICASTLLLARACARLGLDKLFSSLTVVTFAAWGCSFYEASNGMEMGLLAAAFLVMVNELLSPRPRPLFLAVGAAVAVTTRFEAVFYVALLALTVVCIPKRRAFWAIALPCATTVVLLSCWRLAVFSDLLPNTYWAKRWPPYAEFDLVGRLVGAAELPRFFLVPLALLAILLRSGYDLADVIERRRQAFVVIASPVLGAIVMGALIGKHWGYEGRIPYFGFPLMLLLFALTFSPWVNAKRGKLRVAVAVGACLFALATSMTGFPSGPLSAAVNGNRFGVSPHSYAESARTFRRFAAAAGLPQPSILTPDVGGLALCCDEFRVVDLALLSNRQLATRGHRALPDVLASESPDLVEAHWNWASSGKLYQLPYFEARYVPAFADGTKLWIRRDVARTIESKGLGCRVSIKSEIDSGSNSPGCTVHGDSAAMQAALAKHRYANHDTPEDRTAFAKPGFVFVLSQGRPDTNGPCGAGRLTRDHGGGWEAGLEK